MEPNVSVNVDLSVGDHGLRICEEFSVDKKSNFSAMQISAISETMAGLIKLELTHLLSHSD